MKLLIAILAAATSLSAAETARITIALVGDSTVTDSAGWGKAFAAHFDDSVEVKNFALGGRSSKSYIDEGRLGPVLAAKPDYVFIQFGHNGQPGKGPKRETDPATSYRDFLRMYVTKSREIGTKPVLVTSVTRRRFDKNNQIITTLGPWAEATRAVAKEMKVPLIDLHRASIAHHNKIGPKASATFSPKEGDFTHFNKNGAKAIAQLVIEEMIKSIPDLANFLRRENNRAVQDRLCTSQRSL